MDDKSLTVGDRLKKFRESVNISARQMAISINVDQSHYNKSERGERNLSEDNYKDLSALYDLNIQWLLTGTGDMRLTTSDKVKAIAQGTGKPHEEKGIFSKVAGLFKKIPEPEKEDLMTFNEIIEWEEDLLRRYEELKKKNQDKNKND